MTATMIRESSFVAQIAVDSAFRIAKVLRISTGVRDSLKMCLPLAGPSGAPLALPDGYAARAVAAGELSEGEIDAWRRVLVSAGFKGASPRTFVAEYLDHSSSKMVLLEAGASIVGVGGVRDVGCAEEGVCVLGWVGVDPAHRGRGLGKAITALAIETARCRGKTLLCLSTDDFRIPAIKSYVSAGFRPCLNSWDRSHHCRWRRIARELGCKLKFCCDPSHRAVIAAIGGVAVVDSAQ